MHPPGVVLAVAPAAWIGRLTTDRAGFALAAFEFAVVGATSAVLVAVVISRSRQGRRCGRGQTSPSRPQQLGISARTLWRWLQSESAPAARVPWQPSDEDFVAYAR